MEENEEKQEGLTEEEKAAARGDVATGEEKDEDEDEEVEVEKEEKKEEIDPEALKKIAEEEETEKDKPIMIPKSRLDEEISKRRELEAQLEDAKKVEPKKEESAEAYDLKAALKRKNEALVDGDVDLAADIEMEIEAEKDKKRDADDKARRDKEKQDERQSSLQERVNTVAVEAYEKYSFLDPNADIVNNKAIKEVKAKRDEYYAEGLSIEEALQKAVDEVGPKYLSDAGEDKSEGEKKRRDKEAKLNNADAARRQPANLGGSGSQGRVEAKDLASMSRADFNKAWDSMSESERKKYRGDTV